MDTTIFKLEHEIREMINKDNKCDVSFKYEKTKNSVYTFNPKHNQSFLLYASDETMDKEKFLNEVLLHLKHKLPNPISYTYTVKWLYKGKTYSSYFAVNDFEDIGRKFYADKYKNKHDFIIVSCELNPLC